MMKMLWTLLLVTTVYKAHAGLEYYPKSFLEKITPGNKSLSSNDLKDSVFALLSQKHVVLENGNQILAASCAGHDGRRCFSQVPLGYRQARKFLFGKLHLRKDINGYYVKGVYCQVKYNRKTRGIGKIGPMQIPNANTLNCEHTWPQSRFSSRFPKGIQKGDLHHLYPTNSKANSLRSNHEFAEVDSTVNETVDCKGPRLGILNSNIRSYFYEPPKIHRGNVARALFYFSTRYKIHISADEEAFLRKWHEEDPVDQEEIERNNLIEEIQKNRNPYIDFPHLVNEIKDF